MSLFSLLDNLFETKQNDKNTKVLFENKRYNNPFTMPRLFHPVWGNIFKYHINIETDNKMAESIGNKIMERIEELEGITLLPVSTVTGSNVIQIKLMPMNNVKKAYSLHRQIKYVVGREDIRISNDGNKIVVEIPYKGEAVLYGDFLHNPEYRIIKSKTTIPIGQNEKGIDIYGDIAKMPHMLVAGQTGSGKSVFLNTVICSLLMKNSPNDIRMILIDPKMVEFSRFSPIHHVKYISETSNAVKALSDLCNEMDNRYRILAKAGCRDIDDYNSMNQSKKLPKIILVIDELADMMSNKEYRKGVEQNIVRIAQKARAAGIHMILATQRPSKDIITGVIKANIPCRVALRVFSNIDSRVIIDKSGAELLNGYGDMLYVDGQSPNITRLQGGYVSKEEMDLMIKELVLDNQPDTEFKLDYSKHTQNFIKAYEEYYGKQENIMYNR